MRAFNAAIVTFLTFLSLTTAQGTLVYNDSQLNIQSNNQYSGGSLSGYHVGAGASYMVAVPPDLGFSFSFNLSASAYQLLNNDIVTDYQLPCYIINAEQISNNSGPLECGVAVQDNDYFVASVTSPSAQNPGVVTFSGILGWYVCAVQSFTYGWVQGTIVGSFASGLPSGDGVQNCTAISGLAFAIANSTSTTTTTSTAAITTATVYTNHTAATKPTSVIYPAVNTTLTVTSTVTASTTSTTQSTSSLITDWVSITSSVISTTATVTVPRSSSAQSSFQASPFPPLSSPTIAIITPPAVPNEPPYSGSAQSSSSTSDQTPASETNQPSTLASSQAPSSPSSTPEPSMSNTPPSSTPLPSSSSTTLLTVEASSIPFSTSTSTSETSTTPIPSSMVTVTMTRACSTDQCPSPSSSSSSSIGPVFSSTTAPSSASYTPSLSYSSFVPVATWQGAAAAKSASSWVALVFAIAVLML